jgi:hypothetical protein
MSDRENRYAEAIWGKGSRSILRARAVMAAPVGLEAGLRAEVERLEQLLRTMDHFADVAETCERKTNDTQARLDALVADLRRLADEWGHDWVHQTGPVRTGIDYVNGLRAALSSDPKAGREGGGVVSASPEVVAAVQEALDRHTVIWEPSDELSIRGWVCTCGERFGRVEGYDRAHAHAAVKAADAAVRAVLDKHAGEQP